MASAPEPPAQDYRQLQATRIVLRPIANPFALGFTGLAGASSPPRASAMP